MTTGSGASVKRMRLRYDGACASCGVALAKGVQAIWDRDAKVVRCLDCHGYPGAAPEPVELGYVEGEAGASAAREFERRHQARHDRVTSAHPRLGKVLLAVFVDPQSTKAWAQGASGEQSVGESLRQVAGEDVRVLNDRRIPRSRANIDHIAISRLGVFVIDAKRYRNQRPSLRVEGGLFSPRRELLLVGGRNRSPLVDGVHRQVQLVRDALAQHPDVQVRGVLCFLDADWPLLGGTFSVQDVDVVHPRKLRETLRQPGPLAAERIAGLQWELHEAFPR